ncbi:HlyD family efflux transporter periplasmic adaptor subunit [Pseudomonas sp. EL_65y_Pfl2_R95]|uniref:HlyD family efflux transporter periplasmic adaptor subunit n=1 Tax=Pseudomonas sp. EL_65y_Pfl2_R95 TaxID=3088698 RepID=UPI0030DB1DD0
MKKPLILVALMVGLVIAALIFWNNSRSDDETTITLYGNVDIRQVSLAFDGNGRVAQLRAEEGDSVKAGAVLAVLDTRTLALQAEQAQAQITVQEKNLLRLRNGSRPEEVAQARSRFAAANADTKLAEQNLRRLQNIASKTSGRGVSVQDLDRAKSSLQVAKAKGAEQQEALRLAQLGPRAEDVGGAEAQLQVSQAQLALLQHQIDQGTLIAPADAVVRSRLLEPGDMATPQRPVFALALTQPKWVRVYISETDLGRIKPGMSAQVYTDSYPDQPIAGRVGYISSVAEFTPKAVQTEELRTKLVYEVRVQVDDSNNVLRLGQPATVALDGSTARE